jgi:hypothetical protein
MGISLPLIFLFLIVLLIIPYKKIYERFQNSSSNYPCRVFLTDEDFLKHMITHHQIGIDISVEHMKHTKNGYIMKILKELIRTQEYEVYMMNEILKRGIENVSIIIDDQPFIPTVSSSVYPNTISLTDTYCDPSFFNSTIHQHHQSKNMIITDTQYIHHMIPHHQVAIDMSKILLKHTKNDFLTNLCYGIIRGQESEIILLNNLLFSSYIT